MPPKFQPSSRQRTAGALVGFAVGTLFAALFLWTPLFIFPVQQWIVATFAPVFAADLTVWVPLWMFLAIFGGCFVAVAVHECGHALAGAWAGFRFNSLRIFGLEFHRGLRVSWHRSKGTSASGWTAMSLVKHDHITLRAAAMILAGPLSNLLSLALLLLLPISKGFFAAGFAFWSLLIGIGNLIPFRNRGMVSDGGRILMLLRGRAEGERWVAMIRLGAELKQGVMPQALSSEWIAKAIGVRNDSPDTVAAHTIAYAKAFYEPDDKNAAMLLETCLQYSGFAMPVLREALISDAAVFQARKRKRVDLAEQWLLDLPAKTEMPWLRLRAEAAILEAKEDTQGAINKLREVEKLIMAIPDEGRREISLRLLRHWIQELESICRTVATAQS
jgi:hypothetical protein